MSEDNYTVERMPLPIEELKVIANLTVELVKLRQNECKHLAIENIGPEIWRNLLMVTYPPPRVIVQGTPPECGSDLWPSPDSAGDEHGRDG